VEPGKKQRKKTKVGKARVELQTIRIAAATFKHCQSLHHKQDSLFLTFTKWPFSSYCVMPRNQIINCRHNYIAPANLSPPEEYRR